jgi:hypothetical protein
MGVLQAPAVAGQSELPHQAGRAGGQSQGDPPNLTGFEDSNSSANISIDSKAAGQRRIPPNIGENLTLLDNGSNGDSVPATVPASELGRLTRQRLKLALTWPAAV